ncbi:MAG: diphosphate--fructose-6-phosphate 1-phosphotransferase [Thermomicrobiales bacterium]|nr:diphosphate--fructose-6-phosphate 1-phosphotransferase [Thermomicrobiales bacterium]
MTGRTLIVGQSGGATAVTNATLAGIVRAAQESGAFGQIRGMGHGLRGLLSDDFFDLTPLTARQLDQLAGTPSAALGTSRIKLTDEQIEEAAHQLAKQSCADLVLIGGNDSADTVLRLHDADPRLRACLAPKTIDNDLPGTDFCPGYPSAASMFATVVRNATWDSLAAPDLYPVKFIDAMGRDAGWLTAAASLAFGDDETDLQPLLILPERPPAGATEVLDLVEQRLAQRGWAVCVLPETMRDAGGRHLSGDTPAYVDPFGHPYLVPPAVSLAADLTARLGIQARFERPGSFLRMTRASVVDRVEAERAGVATVRMLEEGHTGVMTGLRVESTEPLAVSHHPVDLRLVANRARVLEDGYIGADGHSVTDEFRAFALPLLGENPFPAYLRLERERDVSGQSRAGGMN